MDGQNITCQEWISIDTPIIRKRFQEIEIFCTDGYRSILVNLFACDTTGRPMGDELKLHSEKIERRVQVK